MIKSMTGFGSAELKSDDKTVYVEIRSLNNKYLKINTKIPESLAGFEDRIGKLLKEVLLRGTVTLSIDYKVLKQEPRCFINRDVLKEYYKLISEIRDEISFEQDVSFSSLISLPGVLEYRKDIADEEDAGDSWAELEVLIRSAVYDLDVMKQTEGNNLRLDIEKWTKRISLLTDNIESESDVVVEKYRDRIYKRVQSLLEGANVSIEKEDLYKEVAIFADRCDISEELVRLRSHLTMFWDVVGKEEPAGRKLEFIVQEMFREANTIGSKANNTDIVRQVIEIKTEIERVKEQVLNVE
ncbi:MAG: YicC family protein [Planctomycetes bacterium]|nr:YicC family protein [Planctomycetota bacterium]